MLGSEVHIPAGTYMVRRSLQIKGSNTTTPYYHAAVSGDGKASTIIRAAKSGESVQWSVSVGTMYTACGGRTGAVRQRRIYTE